MDPIKEIYLRRQKDAIAALQHTKVPRQNIRASELSRCKRQIFYRLSGYIPAVPSKGMTGARLSDYGEIGDLLHDDTRRWLKANGAKVAGFDIDEHGGQSETESHTLKLKHKGLPFTVSLRLDGFIWVGARKMVLEIKTLGAGKFRSVGDIWQRTRSDASVLAWVEREHKDFLFQTHACMKAAKLTRAYVLLVDRSECARGLHHFVDPEAIMGGSIISFKQSVWDEVIARCWVVTNALKMDVPPKPEFNPGTKPCNQCNFFHLCHGADQRRQANLTPHTLHPQLGLKLHVTDLK